MLQDRPEFLNPSEQGNKLLSSLAPIAKEFELTCTPLPPSTWTFLDAQGITWGILVWNAVSGWRFEPSELESLPEILVRSFSDIAQARVGEANAN